jgi:hypothetical protein
MRHAIDSTLAPIHSFRPASSVLASFVDNISASPIAAPNVTRTAFEGKIQERKHARRTQGFFE